VIIELDTETDTFTIILEAVRRQALHWRDYHASLDDEYVLHVHHGREQGAVIADGLRTAAANTLAEYQRVFAFLEQAHAGGGPPSADPVPQP
jgi:hypothetical protein